MNERKVGIATPRASLAAAVEKFRAAKNPATKMPVEQKTATKMPAVQRPVISKIPAKTGGETGGWAGVELFAIVSYQLCHETVKPFLLEGLGKKNGRTCLLLFYDPIIALEDIKGFLNAIIV